MNRKMLWKVVMSCGVAASACRSGGAPPEPQAASPHGQKPLVASQGGSLDGTGHRFSPRHHAPRKHLAPPPPPALTSLPRMRERLSACYGVEREDYHGGPVGIAGGGYGHGAGYGSGAAAPKRRSQKPKPATAMPARSGPAPAAEAKASRSAMPPPPADARKESAPGRPQAPMADMEAEEGAPLQELARADAPGYHDWGASIYLSNDDTMSLSSAQRTLFAIDKFLPLPPEHIRPHEMLNYFTFETAPVAPDNDFSVMAGIAAHPTERGIYSLALSVTGRPMDTETRRNANLSIVVDRSGSMQAEGRMTYLKRGLLRMVSELKAGDLVHMVLFDDSVCVPLENFVVGRDPRHVLEEAIARLEPRGSTDLHSGLRAGYEIADSAYQPMYTNRVVMITDALTNTGVTDEELISLIGKYYDQRRIRLSGVGVGIDFNDSLLDRLTERGKGAYVFLGSEAEVDAVFGERFVSLVETTATDVHFRLHLPPSLRMNVFYGEESSVNKEDVQAIHYFANTSQLFLSDLMAKGDALREQDQIMLTVEYEHPETGDEMVEEYAFTLGDIARAPANVDKGRLVMRFVDGLAELAARPIHGPAQAYSWADEEAFMRCEAGRDELSGLSRGLSGDPEVRRVNELWSQYCSRFERVRRPVRRSSPASRGWPSAQSANVR